MRSLIAPVLMVCAAASGCNSSAGSSGVTPSDAPADGAHDANAPSDGVPSDGGTSDAAPTECDGYEPCGIHPVEVPAGYALLSTVDTDEYGGNSDCTDWADCGMWNTHYTSNYTDSSGQPVDPYYNRMGSPFPWGLSRYIIDVAPGKIQYAKLHVLAPGEMYRYSDGTLEERIDRTSGQATCFQRGASMASAAIETLGGTGNHGNVTWNISVLPGDMGSSGNASTCTGTGVTNFVKVTADPATAAMLNSQGKLVYCLLREGHDYYVNFQSSGSGLNFDCSVDTCTMGGWVLANFTGSDASTNPAIEVACP